MLADANDERMKNEAETQRVMDKSAKDLEVAHRRIEELEYGRDFGNESSKSGEELIVAHARISELEERIKVVEGRDRVSGVHRKRIGELEERVLVLWKRVKVVEEECRVYRARVKKLEANVRRVGMELEYAYLRIPMQIDASKIPAEDVDMLNAKIDKFLSVSFDGIKDFLLVEMPIHNIAG
jgi:hypothetical protein